MLSILRQEPPLSAGETDWKIGRRGVWLWAFASEGMCEA
jgi:hypothetical protein